MFWQVHSTWRRLSPLLHCSDGSASVTLVAESASLVLQEDILLPLCPVVELILSFHVDKSLHTPGNAPTWLLLRLRRACPSSWSPAPSSRGWLQKRCLLPRGSTRSAEGLRHPCTRSQTEVEVPCVDARIRQQYLFSWIRDWTSVKLCATVKKQILGTSLSPCG